ncbi:MAG: tetratricopeptide repeat protein [Pyrinomonadaceae bacterium]
MVSALLVQVAFGILFFPTSGLAQISQDALIPAGQKDLNDLRKRGFALLQKGAWSEANSVFEEILKQDKRDELSLYGNSLALFNLNRVSEAEENIKKAIGLLTEKGENSPLLPDALVLSGVISATLHKNSEAVKALERAVGLAPEHFDANFSLARALFGNGDLVGAVRFFTKSVSIQPQNLKARFFLATALERKGDLEEALKQYRLVVKQNPNYPEGNLGLGSLLIKTEGDSSADGLSALQKAVGLNGNLYEAQILLGKTLVRLNRSDDAVPHLQKAAELAPENPEPHYQLALAFRRIGKKKEAADEMAKVKKIHETRRGVKEND